ncbi:MAG: hypothetical protein K0Q77_39 [Anaerosporomusa subterranea]|nr:hypothetical protein [Anaerosporomusa subterranea]
MVDNQILRICGTCKFWAVPGLKEVMPKVPACAKCGSNIERPGWELKEKGDK